MKLQAWNPTAHVRCICGDVYGQLDGPPSKGTVNRSLKFMQDYVNIFGRRT